MISDKTGRKLKVGQMVNIMVVGMVTGKVIDIKDKPIVLSPQQQISPHIATVATFTPLILPNGQVPEVYIVEEADPKDPVVQEWESRNSAIKPS